MQTHRRHQHSIKTTNVISTCNEHNTVNEYQPHNALFNFIYSSTSSELEISAQTNECDIMKQHLK